MKNLFALAGMLALLFLSLSFRQDNNGPDTRLVIINFPDSVVHARILIARSSIKPDRDKIYYWYTPECINANQGGFSGYLLHGDYSIYDRNQHLIVKGSFSKGLKTGAWKRWYTNGNLSEIATWRNGLLSGPAWYYDQSGKQIREIKFKNGNEVGKGVIRIKKKKKTDEINNDSLKIPIDTIIMNQVN